MQHHRNLFRPIWSSRRSKQTENVVVRIIILFPGQSTSLLFFISRSILTKQRKCSHSHSPVATQAHPAIASSQSLATQAHPAIASSQSLATQAHLAIASSQTLVARDNRHYRSNNSVWSVSIQRIHHCRQVNYPKKLRKGRVKLFSPDSCLQEPSFENKRYGILNFCFKFKMAAKNQNGGQNVTMVNISAVISLIMIIFSAFIIFPRPRSLIPDIILNFGIQYGG